MSETQIPIESDFSQQNHLAATVSAQLKVVHLLDSIANNYADWKCGNKANINQSSHQDYYARAKTGLTDLYFAQNNPDALHQFESQWGEEGDVFKQRLAGVQSDIKRIFDDVELNANHMTPIKRAVIALRAAQVSVANSKSDTSFHLLQTLGYTSDTLKKIGLSAALTAGTTIGANALLGAGMAWGATHNILPDIQNPNTQLAVMFSYVLQYLAVFVNAKENVHALRNTKIESSPNINSTVAYLLLKKLVPENEKLQNAAIIFTSFAPAVIGEFMVSSPLLLPNGSSIVIAKNIASTIAQLATAAGVRVWRQVKK